MAPSRAPSAALQRSLRILAIESRSNVRAFSTAQTQAEELQTAKPAFYRNPDPLTVFNPRLERKLYNSGTKPIGSRRRRAAIAQAGNIPFDELPYQCFQEARQILIEDRAEKLRKIEVERARITRLIETEAKTIGDEAYKQKRLKSMQTALENMKILADVNDPNVKRRFEDGKGDMSKPIYRYLADRKWRDFRRKIAIQRITQLKVVPDVLPHIDPIIDVKMSYGISPNTHKPHWTQPGDFVPSSISAWRSCVLYLQSFERGERLVTIAVVDSDVPNLETDSFDSRCHFLATNVRITPTTPRVELRKLTNSQVMLPWLPPYAQKGSPYHRLSTIVLQHKDNIPIDVEAATEKVQRDGFSTRSFITRHMLTPVGAHVFRTKWDDTMAEVMAKAGIEGGDMELKRTKVEPLKYKRRNPSTFR